MSILRKNIVWQTRNSKNFKLLYVYCNNIKRTYLGIIDIIAKNVSAPCENNAAYASI